MTDPLAVPRDPAARVEDDFVATAVRSIAAREAPPLPPIGTSWLRRARPHGVLRQIVSALGDAGHTLPLEVVRHRRDAVPADLLLTAEARVIGRALDSAGIPWVLVKGPVLAHVVYHRRGSREFSDLDVLVAPGDLRRAVAALIGVQIEVLGVDWSQRTWANGSEVPMRSPRGTLIDLHWHLINRRFMRRVHRLDPSAVIERRMLRPVSGVDLPAPDDLDLALHVMLHACLDGCGRWRALLDVQQTVSWLAGRGHSPSDLDARAHAHRVRAASWVVLSLVADELDPTVRPWVDAMRGRTAWARLVVRRSRRESGSPLVDGVTRRLVRYTAPTTWQSAVGVSEYLLDRLVRMVRPDVTALRPEPTHPDDASFETFLARAEGQR